MKRKLLILLFFGITLITWSQENMVTISGGYAFANIEDSDEKGTGWRINGLYEFNPGEGIFAHGVSFGYIHLVAEDADGLVTSTSKINSFPIYYAPKVMFGNEAIKGFIKGAVGLQFAKLKREGLISLSDGDFGFYGGGGAGVMVFINENIFINIEYEIAWASNGWYKDGWMNTAMAGIGYKF